MGYVYFLSWLHRDIKKQELYAKMNEDKPMEECNGQEWTNHIKPKGGCKTAMMTVSIFYNGILQVGNPLVLVDVHCITLCD